MSPIASRPSLRRQGLGTNCPDAVEQDSHLRRRLIFLHQQLAKYRPDELHPSPEINALFSELVGLCIQPHPAALTNELLESPELRDVLQALRKIASNGEFCMEQYWTARLTRPSEPTSEPSEPTSEAVRAFPYYQNYVDLTRMELHAVAACAASECEPISRIAFLGSGPLPLSAIVLAGMAGRFPFLFSPGLVVDCVDISPEATELASRIIDQTCPCSDDGSADSPLVQAVNACATKVPLDGYDLIHVAALVGDNRKAKVQVLNRIAVDAGPDTIVVIRSADGLRRILYPTVDADMVREAGLVLLGTFIPHGDVVNSVIVAKRPGLA
ncbi:Nicotianamine synthase [Polychytrium aggregatum]|uniref:Nicotianamine synthase n=1 Tax=Polychytrium aggregatum TaxID=110093 RepID=UPI0022FEF2BD|nr:Nicotianamine synthase [Polychytrium aggregatum]KAI9208379.1 Nicotianamine synthase [Polychytrium aggregatum]